MKKPEWLFVVVLLLIGGYFSYKYFSKAEVFNPLQLVPKSAIAVYETNNLPLVFSTLKNSAYWQDLYRVKEVKLAAELGSALDSLVAKEGFFGTSFKKSTTLFSIHITGNESVGLMAYLPTGASSRKLLEVVLKKLTRKPIHFSSRVYDNLTIQELTAGEYQLSSVNYKNYTAVSNIGYLVEDVVRNINDDLDDNFISLNKELSELPKLEGDEGNIYINGNELSALYKTWLPPLHSNVGSLAKSLFMDVTMSKTGLIMTGFLFDSSQNDFASIFKDQEAGFPLTIKLVPDNAAIVMSINVSDVNSWYEKWSNEYVKKNPNISKHTQGKDFVKNIKGDISLASFSTNDKSREDKLLLIRLADKEGALNILNREAEATAEINGDSVYFEEYANYSIGLIERKGFVSEIFGEPFAGFSATYFMVHNDYLVMASSAERIKKWLSDLEDDFVWGRSPEINGFITDNLGETSFAIVLSNPWNWSLSLAALNQKHSVWWKENESVIKQFGMASYQFTNLDNKFYTAANVLYEPILIETGSHSFTNQSLTQLTTGILRKPQLVKNHNNGQWEIFVQDLTNRITLLDSGGEVLWQDTVHSAIVGNIYQIDYFKNQKLQYLFATKSALNLVDRNGDIVEGFPVVFRDFEITQLYLIDYDHSKNYRFLVADNHGNLRMLNQVGRALDGWNPKAFNSTLSNYVFHVRVRGKDRILIAKENGNINLLDRSANPQKGFPIDLGFNVENPIHFVPGSTFESSKFNTISSEGTIVEFDLNGKIYGQDQLYQPSSTSIFTLVEDPVQNDYVIIRQDLDRLAILTKEGQVLIEKDYLTINKKEVQYYSFGVDKQLFVVRDTITKQVFLYDKNGTLINADALYSDYPLSVVYQKLKTLCYIYSALDQSVEVNYFPF